MGMIRELPYEEFGECSKKHCGKCKYASFIQIVETGNVYCNYIAVTGVSRPCPAGEGCIVRCDCAPRVKKVPQNTSEVTKCCKECGKWFKGRPLTMYCPECKEIHNEKSKEKARIREKEKALNNIWSTIDRVCSCCGKTFRSNKSTVKRCRECIDSKAKYRTPMSFRREEVKMLREKKQCGVFME